MVPFLLFDDFFTIAAASGYSLMDYTTSKSYDVELGPGKVYDLPTQSKPQVSDRPLRCQNCGAPRKTSVCEYCGTVY